MIKMRVYSQRTVNVNGIQTQSGEDALPFVNRVGMFVADGLGGSAGIPIVSVPEDLFDPEKLTQRLLALYPELDDKGVKTQLADYIRESFASLTNETMKSLYAAASPSVSRMKKSGYFGSHALGVVLARYMMQVSSIEFGDWPYEKWKEYFGKVRENILKEYKRVIDALDIQYAKTTFNKIEYYGTTLSAAFFRENKDSVDVIYMNSGDSRCYVLDAKGFRQDADDQGRNGGMTNLISLTEGAPTGISFEERHYQKPCVFFCVTDGVYNTFGGSNGFASSPLYMEGYLMKMLANAGSTEEAEQRIKNFFDAQGGVDDSNSMAITAFGYETYAELGNAARSRLNTINRKYQLDDLPNEFFFEDYHKRVLELQKQTEEQILPELEKAYSLPEIQQYCKDRIRDDVALSRKYRVKEDGLRAEITRKKNENEQYAVSLVDRVKKNYADFIRMEDMKRKGIQKICPPWPDRLITYAMAAGTRYNENIGWREDEIQNLYACISSYWDILRSLRPDITFNALAEWTQAVQARSIDWCNQFMSQVDDLWNQCSTITRNIRNKSNSVTSALNSWFDNNERAYKSTFSSPYDYPSPKQLVETWLGDRENDKPVTSMTVPYENDRINDLVRRYHENEKRMEELEAEAAEAFEEGVKQYWQENAGPMIGTLLENKALWTSNPALASGIQAKLDQNKELTKFKDLDTLQQKVFGDYLKQHLSEASTDKRADVEKNGWH